ncbi:MAG TPA: HypC/HybG/HupF family hydrogenase formation chaperone [archaeon]|nr:HypC/HybG/HupF family hydrogenase formation chaperone [archaeon]
MCITKTAKIIAINKNKAIVEIDGKKEEIRIDLVDVGVGDYVYCASGMALEVASDNNGNR